MPAPEPVPYTDVRIERRIDPSSGHVITAHIDSEGRMVSFTETYHLQGLAAGFDPAPPLLTYGFGDLPFGEGPFGGS